MPDSTHDNWVQRLKSSDTAERDSALAELRELIIRGLNRSLNNHMGREVSTLKMWHRKH